MNNIPTSDLLGGIMTIILITSSSVFFTEAIMTLFYSRFKLVGLLFCGVVSNVMVFIVAAVAVGTLRKSVGEGVATFAGWMFLILSLVSFLTAIFIPTIIAIKEKKANLKQIAGLNCLGLIIPFLSLFAHHKAMSKDEGAGDQAIAPQD